MTAHPKPGTVLTEGLLRCLWCGGPGTFVTNDHEYGKPYAVFATRKADCNIQHTPEPVAWPSREEVERLLRQFDDQDFSEDNYSRYAQSIFALFQPLAALSPAPD